MYTGSQQFVTLTKKVGQHFDSKPRKTPPFKFAGISILRPDLDTIVMQQQRYIATLEHLPPDAPFTAFRTMRHKLAWVSNCRPNVLAAVNILSQVTADTYKPSHLARINAVISHLHRHKDIVLKLVKLDR